MIKGGLGGVKEWAGEDCVIFWNPQFPRPQSAQACSLAEMRSVRQYTTAIWSHWVSRLSGIFSIVFILVALVFRLTEPGQARYWVVAAILA